MCRIIGVLSLDEPHISSAMGDKMRDTLSHGGPDDAGNYIDGNLYFGHRRLSVIDLTDAGHQPMHFKNWVIIFNGEIYNYQEIAQTLIGLGYHFNTGSDTEVILKAFDCWSYNFVEHFRGMFAFAIWDKAIKKLLLCRDRVGVKPLYWYQKEGTFIFGSELKALIEHPNFDKTIDDNAVSLFLRTGYVPSPFSIFKYAHKLMPGSFLEIDLNGSVKQWKYWDVNEIDINEEQIFSSEEEIVNGAEGLIAESCRLRMVSDVPVGVFLSGGIDSSLVTALVQKGKNNTVKTFTIGFDDERYDESIYAKKVAKFLGTEHTEYKCTEADFLEIVEKLPFMYDEPFGDSSAIPTHLVSRIARQKVTVALSADGGDEVFAGYDRYRITNDVYKKLQYIPLFLRKLVAKSIVKLNPKHVDWFSKKFFRNRFRGLEWRMPKFANVLLAENQFDFYEKSMSNIPFNLLTKLHGSTPIPLFNSISVVSNYGLYSSLGKADIPTYLEGDILTKVDRAAMHVALEGREPLLDHKIIEFGLSLPDKYKIRGTTSKWLLKQILRKYLPSELIDRPKQGFAIPVKQWLQNNLKHYLDNMAADTEFCELLKLNRDTLCQIVESFYKNDNSAVNPHFMWSLYSLYRWYQRWIKFSTND